MKRPDVAALMDGLLADRPGIDTAPLTNRPTQRQVVDALSGALDVTGEPFPSDYQGVDDLTLARTYTPV